MARVLICGTLAYDDIGTFESPLNPDTRNVKLTSLARGFGGCAMNLAYNLAGLGHEAVPFVYAGDDYSGEYAHHVARCGISEAGIFRIPGTPSARGIVLTGVDGAQFTAFYPGPSGLGRWQTDLVDLTTSGHFDAVILAPDLPDKMAGQARVLQVEGPKLWCPGQYAELLDAAALEPPLDWCDLLVANRHEWQALCRLLPETQLVARAGRAIVTDGAGPVRLLPDGTRVEVPAPETVTDPTGCGDAFAAALAAALLDGANLADAVRRGTLLAARCLACHGAQGHLLREPASTR